MSEQKLFEFRNEIKPKDVDDIVVELDTIFVDDYIYSFIVYIKCDDECNVITYQVKHIVSDEKMNNTLYIKNVIQTIVNAIIEHKTYKGKSKVICYGQPPIGLMVELYEPLIDSLSRSVLENWSQYELDDLKQICRMSMIELYNKGYYVHKRLLKKVFNRKILQEVRPLKRRGEVISIYTRQNLDYTDGDEKLTIKDTLEDTDAIIAEEERDILEGELKIFEEVKGIVIDIIGERRWDMLFRDYTRGHTTNVTRLEMKRIKEQLKALGYTRDIFNRRYH